MSAARSSANSSHSSRANTNNSQGSVHSDHSQDEDANPPTRSVSFAHPARDDASNSDDESNVELGLSTRMSSRSQGTGRGTSLLPLPTPRRIAMQQTGTGTTPSVATMGTTTPHAPAASMHTVPPLPPALQNKRSVSAHRTMLEDKFVNTESTMDELTDQSGFVSRYKRKTVQKEQPKMFVMWEERVNRGLPEPKFKLVSQDLSDEALLLDTQNLYGLLERFERRLKDLDLAYGFTMIDNIDWADPKKTVCTGPSLLENDAWLSWSTEEVATTQVFYMVYGGDIHRDTQKRACRFVLESMEPTLKLRVESQLYNLYSDPMYHGGLLAFKLLMNQLTVNTYDMRIKLINLLDKIDIKDYAGQHVPTAVDRINPLLVRLDGVLQRNWPNDLVFKLIRVFQTTSCDDFNRYFQECERSLRGSTQGVLAARQQVSIGSFANLDGMLEITADAVTQFHTISADKGWDYKGGSGSVYTGATDTAAVVVPRHCWNCNSTEHQLKSCPKPRNHGTIDANKKRFNAIKKKIADQKKKKKPQAEAHSPPRAFQVRSVNRIKDAPKKKESHKQIINGRLHFWCGRQGDHCFWNMTHLTKDHAAWEAQLASSGSPAPPEQVQANTAALPSPDFYEQAFSSWQ